MTGQLRCWHNVGTCIFRGTIAATASAAAHLGHYGGVHVAGEGARGVPEHLLHDLDVHPGREAERGAAVPQVVKPDGRQPRLAHQHPEVLGDKVIMAAVGRQAVSPETAIRWARRAARGEDISAVGLLSAGTARHVEAPGDTNLAGRIVSILTQILGGHGRQQVTEPDEADPSLAGLRASGVSWGDGGGGRAAPLRPGPLIFDNQTRASAELSDEEDQPAVSSRDQARGREAAASPATSRRPGGSRISDTRAAPRAALR